MLVKGMPRHGDRRWGPGGGKQGTRSSEECCYECSSKLQQYFNNAAPLFLITRLMAHLRKKSHNKPCPAIALLLSRTYTLYH